MNKTVGTRHYKRAVPVILLLAALCLSLGTCNTLQKAVQDQRQSGMPISMDMIVPFDQYQGSITIRAPAMKVWDTLVDPRNMSYIYSYFKKIVFLRGQEIKLERGMHLGFETTVAGEIVKGDAIVTNYEPGVFLSFTVLRPQRNILTLTMREDAKGKTHVLIHVTMQSFQENMAVTNFEIRQSINDSIRQTLKNLKKATLGQVPMDQQQSKAGLEFVSEGLEPFQFVHYSSTLPVSIETIWLYFLEDGSFARVLDQMNITVSENLVQMLQLPGVGVPYESDVGPFHFRGITLVTEMIPDLTIDIALLHSGEAVIPGGAHLRFITKGKNVSEVYILEYFRIPDEFDCKPVDEEALKAALTEKAQQVSQLAQWASEKHPKKSIWKLK